VGYMVSQPRNGSGNADLRLTSPSLRTWLCECWAIIFSHPGISSVRLGNGSLAGRGTTRFSERRGSAT